MKFKNLLKSSFVSQLEKSHLLILDSFEYNNTNTMTAPWLIRKKVFRVLKKKNRYNEQSLYLRYRSRRVNFVLNGMSDVSNGEL